MEDIVLVRETLKKHKDRLLKKKNVVAVGVGFKVIGGQVSSIPSIICSVTKKLRPTSLKDQDMVPYEVDGIPTDVIETGVIRAFQSPTGRFRPALGGVSIGHYAITAGTLGCLVRKAGVNYILSNNHVLANSNAAKIGDAIIQPGQYDGGVNPADEIATLSEFIPIQFGGGTSGCPISGAIVKVLNGLAALVGSQTRLEAISIQAATNLVDAALAKPTSVSNVRPDILGIGNVLGTIDAALGMKVKKSGRTTGVTQGEIIQTNVTVNVQYGGGKIATFTDQLMAGAMSQGGDSGSTVLDNSNRIVGLLFAGSETTTIMNRIGNVFSALGVTL